MVEDDPTTCNALRRMFGLKGWEVSTAATVAEGLALLESEPDCLVLDLMLPDGDGMSLLQRVRSRRLKTRVAVCTGIADPRRLALVKELDPEALLRKPIDFKELCRACEAMG